MKLIDMTCTGCGANVTVDSALKVATCTVCGKKMLISRSGEYGAGYDREMGRIQAQLDMEQAWKEEREEKLRKEEEEKKRRMEQAEMDRIRHQLNKICIAEAVICFLFLASPIVNGAYLGDVYAVRLKKTDRLRILIGMSVRLARRRIAIVDLFVVFVQADGYIVRQIRDRDPIKFTRVFIIQEERFPGSD